MPAQPACFERLDEVPDRPAGHEIHSPRLRDGRGNRRPGQPDFDVSTTPAVDINRIIVPRYQIGRSVDI